LTYQRDYIIRLIERFAQALRILRDRLLRRDVDATELRTTLSEVAHQAGLDLDLARQLDPGMLVMWLTPTGEIDEGRLWLMAELLYLSGLDDAAPDAEADLDRALAVFTKLPQGWRPTDGSASAGERVAEIRERLEGHRP
jgi:hypothetical protein